MPGGSRSSGQTAEGIDPEVNGNGRTMEEIRVRDHIVRRVEEEGQGERAEREPADGRGRATLQGQGRQLEGGQQL